MENETIPKVSVCVITYNQEKYIRQCLTSIVHQKTNFEFEVIVGDDCSTDGTTKIVQEFAENYPKIIRAFCHKKNMGGSDNNIFVHSQARGNYIAHMDGDDYALPGKLQTQADFLDHHPNCNLVWTPILVETAPGSLHEQGAYFKENALTREYSRADLIKYGTIGVNSSKMYRKLNKEQLANNPDFELIDYLINVAQVGEGVACFAGRTPLGVYRMGIGVASSGSATKRLTLKSIELLSKAYPQYRLECNIAVLTRCLTDIKNRRRLSWLQLSMLMKTFHWKSIFVILRELRFIKSATLRRVNS